MSKSEGVTKGTKHSANIEIEGMRKDLKGEFITLLEALDSDDQARDFLHNAIEHRVNSLIEEYKELEDDGEL